MLHAHVDASTLSPWRWQYSLSTWVFRKKMNGGLATKGRQRRPTNGVRGYLQNKPRANTVRCQHERTTLNIATPGKIAKLATSSRHNAHGQREPTRASKQLTSPTTRHHSAPKTTTFVIVLAASCRPDHRYSPPPPAAALNLLEFA